MNEKIENNPSFQQLKQEMESAEALINLTQLFSLGGINYNELDAINKQIAEFKEQLELISKSSDKFNDIFSSKGWIAHESMNFDLILSCIAHAENKEIDIAEQELINYFCSDKIQYLLHQFYGIKEFKPRINLIKNAYDDTLSKRYHSCIPVLLLVIDGVVNDVNRSKGFFSENSNLIAWDSIAAHSSGLSTIKNIFNESRKRTTTHEISMPYRNGILHGRDTNYANKTVTAKCWATLFAVSDWARAIRDGKKDPPIKEPKIHFNESLIELENSIKNLQESKERNSELQIKLGNWKPRNIKLGINIPSNGLMNDYTDFSTEKESIQFINNWNKKNYGAIATQIYYFKNEEINIKIEAGKIRKIFENKAVKEYSIIDIIDYAPSISEVTLLLKITHEHDIFSKQVTLRLIYEGLNKQLLIHGEPNGKWKFIDSFFHSIQYLD